MDTISKDKDNVEIIFGEYDETWKFYGSFIINEE